MSRVRVPSAAPLAIPPGEGARPDSWAPGSGSSSRAAGRSSAPPSHLLAPWGRVSPPNCCRICCRICCRSAAGPVVAIAGKTRSSENALQCGDCEAEGKEARQGASLPRDPTTEGRPTAVRPAAVDKSTAHQSPVPDLRKREGRACSALPGRASTRDRLTGDAAVHQRASLAPPDRRFASLEPLDGGSSDIFSGPSQGLSSPVHSVPLPPNGPMFRQVAAWIAHPLPLHSSLQ